MAKKNDDRRLLDCWIPPSEAGAPIGCLASTYTFQSDFFEEECLTRFLSIESKSDEDGPVYLIEREEKLNNVSCIAVWVDQAWARQKRNLRWDLVPVRLQNSILHSKICVLQWLNSVRIILGSANITEQAYRKNQEVYAVIDLSSEKVNDKYTALTLVQHLLIIMDTDTYANETIKNKHRTFLNGVIQFISRLPAEELNISRRGYLSFSVTIEPGGISFAEQVKKIWNQQVSNTPPEECFVTSPFFDPPGEKNLPALRLWEILRKKGPAAVIIYTTGEFDFKGNPVRIHAPKSIDDATPRGRSEAGTYWHILSESEDQYIRPLHKKTYWFENNDGWKLLIIGSSNFTSKAWGLLPFCNFEANIAYLTNEFKYKEQYNEVIKTFIDTDVIDVEHINWEPIVGEEERDPGMVETVLPAFFKSATLIKNTDLFIELKFNSEKPPEYFSIHNEDGKLEYFNFKQWNESGNLSTYHIPVEITDIPAFLLIYVNGFENPACWTINIINQDCLPPPEELRNLPLDILTQIITSAKPIHQVLKGYLGRVIKNEVNKELINPHDRVDTSSFLLQKTRKYSFAINIIKSKLEQPCPTLTSLEWRLYGPVGLKALVEAMQREAGAKTSEAVFFLTELWDQLKNVNPPKGEGILPVEIVSDKINEFQSELANKIRALWNISDIESINAYSRKILEK